MHELARSAMSFIFFLFPDFIDGGARRSKSLGVRMTLVASGRIFTRSFDTFDFDGSLLPNIVFWIWKTSEASQIC